MATCQWEGFPKQGDVDVHCQSNLPLWWIQLCTVFLQRQPVPPLCSVVLGRFAQALPGAPASVMALDPFHR